MNFRDESGVRIRLGARIAAAGEGHVHEVEGNVTHLAKIYKVPPDRHRLAKLRCQVAHTPAPLRGISAWPEQVLIDEDTGNVAGFLMRRIDARPIHQLYRPQDRKTYFPRATWSFLLHVAKNLAAAFETLHENGVSMADVNEGNVFVTPDGLVRLIDCDSYQVRDPDGSLFPCNVGTAIWTAPELQGLNFVGLQRTAAHDRFGLAVLLFHLLMMGRHPYAGVPLDGSPANDQFTLAQAIARHQFAYSRARPPDGFRPPCSTLPPEALPADLFELFENAFAPDPRIRPSGKAWFDAIARIGTLRQCSRNPAHEYSNHLGSCPWCRIQIHEGGPDYFVIPGVPVNGQALIPQIDRDWEKWCSVRPVDIAVMGFQSPPVSGAQGKPMPVPLTRGKLAIGKWTFRCLKALGLSPYGSLNPAYVIERDRRKRAWDATVTHVESLIASRNALASDYRSRFDLAVRTLHPRFLAEWRRIHATLAARTNEMETAARRDAFLRGSLLAGANVPGIGPQERAMLRGLGIETALDIRDAVSITTPHPAIHTSLLEWVATCEQRFLREASPALPDGMPDDRTGQFEHLTQEFQQRIADALKTLSELAEETRTKIAQIDAQLAGMMNELERTQADYAVAFRTGK